MKMKQIKHEKLRNNVIKMTLNSNFYFYGLFTTYFSFIEKNDMKYIMGVNSTYKNSTFKMNFYYNTELLKEFDENVKNTLNNNNYSENKIELIIDELYNALIIHECEHILLKHNLRRSSKHNKEIANIAQDMAINYNIFNSLYFNYSEIISQFLLSIPEEYDGEKTFESIYDYLIKDKINKIKSPNGNLRLDFHFDNSDITTPSEKNIIKSEISDIFHRVYNNLNSHGNISSNIEDEFKKIRNNKKLNIRGIKSSFENGFFIEKTYRKKHKFNKSLKGKIKYNMEVNLLIDTSGSFFDLIDKYMNYILNNDYIINLYQIDVDVKNVKKLRGKNDWYKKDIKKIGCGGTDIQNGIDYIIDKKEDDKPLIIITDGYTDDLDVSNYKNLYRYIIIPRNDNTTLSVNGKINRIVISPEIEEL